MQQNRFVRRTDDKFVAGICSSLARTLALEPWLMRLLFVITFFTFGISPLVYVVAWDSSPLEDREIDDVLLGVCRKISIRYQIEVGLVRTIACLFLLMSFGIILIAYVAAYFLMPDPQTKN